MERNQHIARSRQKIAKAVFGASSVVKAPFVFEGGNLQFDRIDDRIRAFIGFNDLLLSINNYNAIKKRFSRARILELIAEQFGVDDVIVVGREEQSTHLFHIDHAFILLADGVAVVNRIEGTKSSREKRQLQYYRSQLEGLGYRVIAIDNTQKEIEQRRSSTNAIPYVDARTGEKKVIYPVYPDEVHSTADRMLKKSDLLGKGLRAYEAYEEAGYEPIPVRDFAHAAGGSTHCITNVIE